MLYTCSWPAYQIDQNPNYELISKICNTWRNYDDIMDSWASVLSIIDYYAKNQDRYAKFHGLCSE